VARTNEIIINRMASGKKRDREVLNNNVPHKGNIKNYKMQFFSGKFTKKSLFT
jgi:hypothetical protein